jgi:hypothetical protein
MMPCLVSKLGVEVVSAVNSQSTAFLGTSDNPGFTVQTQPTLYPGLVTTTSSRDRRALSCSRCQSMPIFSQT